MPRKKKATASEEVVSDTISESIVDENTQSNVQTQEELIEKSNTAIPPILLRRNDYGLLNDVDYKYKENGFVDWRAMIDPQYLYANKDKTNETDISKLRDDQLIIKLGGLRELAQIRGFKSIKYNVTCPSQHYVVVTCDIDWIPNYETEGREISTSAVSTSHLDNSKSFMINYLGEQSENRSYCRAVRAFLGINIVSHEELSDKKVSEQIAQSGDKNETNDIYEPLRVIMSKLKLSFDKLKTKCANAKDREFKGCENWSTLEDIPKNDAFYLLGKLNDALNK